jgi:hypothetical protein
MAAYLIWRCILANHEKLISTIHTEKFVKIEEPEG